VRVLAACTKEGKYSRCKNKQGLDSGKLPPCILFLALKPLESLGGSSVRNLGQLLGTLDCVMWLWLVRSGTVIRHLVFQMLHILGLETCDWRRNRKGLSLLMPPPFSISAAIQAIFIMRNEPRIPLRSSSSLEVAVPDILEISPFLL